MPDSYDQAIAYFEGIDDPEERQGAIQDAWNWPDREVGGYLFSYCCTDRDNGAYGCLTQVRDCQSAEVFEAEIRADDRIPDDIEAVTLESLPVFAEWQRRIDAELGRPEPISNVD